MSFLDFLKNLFGNNKKNARLITKDLTKTFGEKDPLEIGLFEGDQAIKLAIKEEAKRDGGYYEIATIKILKW